MLTKHRDFCGDINNHIGIEEWEEIDRDEEENVIEYRVVAYFIGSHDEVAYEYFVEVEAGEEIDEDLMRAKVIKQVKENWKNK